MEDRKFHFGKHKGEEIKYVILTDIGYITWCLNNISAFLLNDEEWEVYDSIAIMFKKYEVEPPIREEMLYRWIRDKEKWKNLDTPFVYKRGYITVDKGRGNDPVYDLIKKYIVSPSTNQETGWELNHHVCSDAFYAKDDLYYRQSEVREKIRERYGDDVDVKFIDETDINEDDLFIKNREFYKQSEEE